MRAAGTPCDFIPARRAGACSVPTLGDPRSRLRKLIVSRGAGKKAAAE